MIIYNPLNGDAITSSISCRPRSCFLMTRLGNPIPKEVKEIEKSIKKLCAEKNYDLITASSQVTGRDFLLKIWNLIAATPLSIGIAHEEIPFKTQMNIYYELGVAQALGKESILIKSKNAEFPSDFVRNEYILYDTDFKQNFLKYFDFLDEQAEHYELIADQLERDPVLAIDYLRRAFLISGNHQLRNKVNQLLKASGLDERAKNSVEHLAASF